MSQTKKSTVKARAIFAVILVIVYGTLAAVMEKMFYPAIANETALRQFEDTPQSFTDPAALNMLWQFWGLGWIVIIVIIIVMFRREIGNWFTSVSEEEGL